MLHNYILEPIVHPIVCIRAPTSLLLDPFLTGNHWFVLWLYHKLLLTLQLG